MIAALIGRYAGYAALAVALAGGCAWILHEHDRRVLAEASAVQQTAAIAALEQTAREAQARAATMEKIRTVIHAQPVTKACAASPAVRAALDGLRNTGAAVSAR